MSTAERDETSAKVERLVANAARTGNGAHTVALAAALVLPGVNVRSICCWCADEDLVGNWQARRLPAGGDCLSCSYSGRDCIVAWESPASSKERAA